MSLSNVHTSYLTISEVAERLRVSRMTVYRLVHAREIASARFGRSYRVPEQALDEYLRKTTV
jgi:excisionase family DNA binding protein